MSLAVRGRPAPKGSHSAVARGGRAWPIAGSTATYRERLAAWTEAVADAARQAASECGAIAGPVLLAVDFALPRPASQPRVSLHVSRALGDIDKLVRATADPLVAGGLLADDSQICCLVATRRLAGPGEPGGATITLARLDPLAAARSLAETAAATILRAAGPAPLAAA